MKKNQRFPMFEAFTYLEVIASLVVMSLVSHSGFSKYSNLSKNTVPYHLIPNNTIEYHPNTSHHIPYYPMPFHPIHYNTIQYTIIPSDTI